MEHRRRLVALFIVHKEKGFMKQSSVRTHLYAIVEHSALSQDLKHVFSGIGFDGVRLP